MAVLSADVLCWHVSFYFSFSNFLFEFALKEKLQSCKLMAPCVIFVNHFGTFIKYLVKCITANSNE